MKRIIQLICICILISACSAAEQPVGGSLTVSIVDPMDGTHANVGDVIDIHIIPEYPGGELSITVIVNGTVANATTFPVHPQGNIIGAFMPWIPQAAGEYLIQAIMDNQGQSASSNEVTIIVGEPVSFVPDIVKDDTITPSITPSTPSDTPTPGNATATALDDIICRMGPSQLYAPVGYIQVGETVPITGTNNDNSWYTVNLPDVIQDCWVFSTLITITGDVSGVAQVIPPPLPITDTPTLTPTRVITFTPTFTSTLTPSLTPSRTPTRTITPSPIIKCSSYHDLTSCLGAGCTWDTGTNTCY
jgi:uncharacterized protein YgiM (DUF1202 family)